MVISSSARERAPCNAARDATGLSIAEQHSHVCDCERSECEARENGEASVKRVNEIYLASCCDARHTSRAPNCC